jgi:hypothetical protein
MQKEEISECEPPPHSVLTKCKIQTNVSAVSAENRNAYKYEIICTVDYSTGANFGKWRTVLTIETDRFSKFHVNVFDKVKEHISKKTYDTSGLKII